MNYKQLDELRNRLPRKHDCIDAQGNSTGLFCVACVEEREQEAVKCGIANPGGQPCTMPKGHKGGHDLGAYGPPMTDSWSIFLHYPKRILDQTGVVVAEAQSDQTAQRIVDEHNAAAKLVEALELAAKRIDFLTNWIENTYGGSNGDVQLGRQYAAAARDALTLRNDSVRE